MELKGSKTEANLIAAFSGESEARNKYTFYSSAAKEEGYEQISAIFTETANNEKEHAELWFKYLNNNKMPDTFTNLVSAAAGEHYEWSTMYKEFAEIAKEEGFDEIANVMTLVAEIEKTHENRYKQLSINLQEQKVFTRDGDVIWQCRNCGHLHKGKTAPQVCPACKHPQAYFQLHESNY
ncbi:rubrerythrin [Clostridia bacterium]|nr:rubrerythrin [Clostridia bacterium]